MSQLSVSMLPALDANQPLFDSVYKLVCEQAQADHQPPEVVLAQIIYHSSYELFYSDGFTLPLVQGVVEAAALTVAREYEEADAFEQSLIGGAGGAA
ncbi:hypothetical protein [Pseudomonas mosselii]|uniref:Uncharacterized protein n=1 Tax=Pseudomonas mosselii TaxID=78327 RepID=A0A7W2JWD7_9PSED|nr:hypothetical protein [Pseudomonas mosselii]MBA6066375.1 hypothetical protein [Pseudomonas mosselii]MCL8340114.1 hypothetical protein [Pseudomonas mosselii]WJR30618.1 hypothetical protein LU678_011460 [Pseudomonas mosselii]